MYFYILWTFIWLITFHLNLIWILLFYFYAYLYILGFFLLPRHPKLLEWMCPTTQTNVEILVISIHSFSVQKTNLSNPYTNDDSLYNALIGFSAYLWSVSKYVSDGMHGGLWRKDVRISDHELFKDVVLDSACEFGLVYALLLPGHYKHG